MQGCGEAGVGPLSIALVFVLRGGIERPCIWPGPSFARACGPARGARGAWAVAPRRRPPTKPPSHAACQQPARAFLCWVPRSFSLFSLCIVCHTVSISFVCVSSVRACACVRVCLVFNFEILTLCLRELERGMPPSAQASTTPYTHQALSRLGRVPFAHARAQKIATVKTGSK